jgi:uncharacterized membrane protein
MKEFYKKYLNSEIKLEKWQKVGVICLVIVLTGIIGWIYEFIFYFFNSGMKEWYMRGGNFLPWINIYAEGSLMIIFLTRKFKKKPLKIFLISALSTGILEYIAGFLMYHFKDGMRCWDYNTEILSWGSIDGFVCIRSVTIFGLFALALMYGLLPLLMYISTKASKKAFLIFSITLCSIFLLDELYNLIIPVITDLPRASRVYKGMGIKYMQYYNNG